MADRVDPRNLPDMPALMIAGPGQLAAEDLDALAQPVIAHFGDVWIALHDQLLSDLGTLLDAADPPYVMPGTGTVCLDAAVANLFEPGQRVVVADTGFFGTRLEQIAIAHRLEVAKVPVEVGAPIDPARVADAVSGADGILTVHVETATGVRHPIEDIVRVARDNDLLYVVDGIASVGAERCSVDAMGIDALVTASQKALDGPPGLGILALGERGRARIDARPGGPASFYLDLEVWDKYREEWGAWHPSPVTMPSNLVVALASSVRRILETGIDIRIAAHSDLAKRCREGLRGLGLDPVPNAGSEANLVVAMWADDPAAIQKQLLAEGIMISGGLDPTMGKAIRVGLMGATATEEMVDRVVAGVGKALG